MGLELVVPAVGSGPGVLLLHDVHGVGSYLRSVASRLADAGYVVGMPDVFWRFAPSWEQPHDSAGLKASIDLARQLNMPLAIEDCIAALETVHRLTQSVEAPSVIGFCRGGTLAWGVAAHGEPNSCVSYYGSGIAAMLDLTDLIDCPVLLHFGDNDPFIPHERIDAVKSALEERSGFMINIAKAGHAFDDHESDHFFVPDAAASAWGETMAFLDACHGQVTS